MTPLPEQPAADAAGASPTKARRVHATVLFADLMGFTALVESTGAERAYTLTRGCMQLLDGVVRRHGGSIDRFQGDALMAVFGHPVPRADAVHDALGAALEMRRAVEDYVRELSVASALAIRIGVNTGDLVAGDVRGPVVREFHVLGDAVNVAARLKAAAPIGAIYAGPQTRDEARDDFTWKPIEALRLKGKSHPIEPFELIEARERLVAPSLVGPERSDSPFFGRDAPLATLVDAVARLRSGTGGVVLLRGEPGTGKTRLLSQLGRQPVARDTLQRHVQPRSTGSAPPGELAAAIDETLGAGPEPTIVAVDQLERADDASIAHVESLLRELPAKRLLLILSGQPCPAMDTLARTAATSVPESVPLRSIDLAPLHDEEARALLAALSRDQPIEEPDLATLLRRAEGNPARLVLGVHLAPALASERSRDEQAPERSTEAERRRATIVFADLVGFTALTERLGAERAYPMVVGCMRLLDQVARDHGGTVEKHLGDAVMALFGVPEALEDAPRAAVNAAIEMRRRVREYSQQQDLPSDLTLDVHSGIYTGHSISGDVSGPLLREFAVMGEPVVVAAELADRAGAGDIYVGGETWRATRDRFEYASAGSLRVAGLTAAIECFELRSESAQLYRRQVGEPGEFFSEVVGRESEMERLQSRLARLEEGEGAFVSLVAEAGLGKSRLVAELAAQAQEKFHWLEGRSISTGASLGFHPFADLLRSWVGIQDQDDPPRMTEKLLRTLERLLPDDDSDTALFLATVMGFSLGADGQMRVNEVEGDLLGQLIHKSVTRIFAALASERPLVVVFDDLHWADLSSIDLAVDLARLAETHRVLFLCVSRPHFPHTSGLVLDQLRRDHPERLEEIELRPLGHEAVRRLITNLFRGADIPQRVRALIAEKAGGNPFYLEEVARSLVEQEAIVRDRQGFRATERIHEIEIPRTVEEVIRSRIDRLSLEKREVVQLAAVIGRSFHVDVLQRILRRADLESLFDGLSRAGFFMSWDQLQGEELAFKHPLLQEVAYDGQLEEQRRERHQAVGEAIEAELAENIPGYHAMLAFHFMRGSDPVRAEDALIRAGDEAAHSAASNEALLFFREASRLYLERHGDKGDPMRKARLEKNLGLALHNRGQLLEAEGHLNAALRLLGQRVVESEPLLMLRFARNLPLALLHLFRPRRTLRSADDRDREVISLMYRRAQAQSTVSPTRFFFDTMELRTYTDTLDPTTFPNAGGMAASTVGLFSYGGLSFGIGRRFLERGAPLVRSNDLYERVTFAMMNHLHHFLSGNWSDDHCLSDELYDEGLQALALWPLANYLGLETERRIRQGRWSEAQELMARTTHMWDAYGYDLAKTNHYAQPVFLALEQRRLDAARVGADAYRDENPEDLLHILASAMRAEAEILQGDLSAARHTVTRGDEIVRATRFPPPFHLSSHRNAKLLLDASGLESAVRAGQPTRSIGSSARRSARVAKKIASKIVYREPQILRIAGRVEWLLGKQTAALALWERGLATAHRLGMRPEEARLAHEIGFRLSSGPTTTCCGRDAAAWLGTAREIYQSLDLAWDLARLERGESP